MTNKYAGLRGLLKNDAPAGRRCAERLLKMRASLQDLRARKSDDTLMLATWNIRDFDSNKFGYGYRLPETFYYLAEIISCFDLVALQEVNRDLSGLETLMRILGREWDYIATDTTEGPGGNGERMAFVFNTEKVWFRKIAGEVVLPEGQLIVTQKKKKASKADAPALEPGAVAAAKVKEQYEEVKQQFARSPFLVAFQSGWFRFSLCTVHIYYGEDRGAKLQQRIDEIDRLVSFFKKRQDSQSSAERDRSGAVENYLLLGDFNVVSPEHETMKALKRHGFLVPEQIDGDKVRKDGQHYYDQIAARVKDKRFKVIDGGMVDMYADVFRDEDLPIYQALMPAVDPEKSARARATTPEKLFNKWRTWQMSDHHPLWIQIKTDFADTYLSDLLTPPQP
ncbi:MAG: endonuclease [Phenylobacterium sp.]|uniref:endonuclease/exonuclease/phosphatase family protein n=1 Tax=Phenylobacterium sp. TaxID=1871053 RepID=UPI0012086201|nr:endonuclease/exonuclease/phosphatase family protein [Phenylobacterium sp.]TAJ71969.1 MAG: endonuclease [Phenylobacterium sp.]